MAKITFGDVNKYIDKLYSLYDNADSMIEEAVNIGAGVMADGVRASLSDIPIDDRIYIPEGEQRRGLRTIQWNGLYHSMGVSPIRNDGGFINRKIGFDGYNNVETDRWPSGQPNAMVARSVESGTYFMKKTPFMSKAIRATKAQTEAAMQTFVDSRIFADFNK